MLSLNIGLFVSGSGVISGRFTIFGKEFVVYLNQETEKANPNGPDYYLTIKEANK